MLGNIIESCLNNYNKGEQIINYFVHKYEKNTCNYNRLKQLFILSDRYHLRQFGRTISESRMYKYNYFLTMLKKYIEKQKFNYKFVSNNLISNKDIDLNVFSDTDIETMNKVFDHFKRYNNNQLDRYIRTNFGLVEYVTKLFDNIPDDQEYCKVPFDHLELSIEIYNKNCELDEKIRDGKRIIGIKVQ